MAVLLLDIDDFRTVNDAFGHAAGDATLIEVAHRLGLTLRANDTLARLSGDGFVILCEDLDAGPEQTSPVSTQARTALGGATPRWWV